MKQIFLFVAVLLLQYTAFANNNTAAATRVLSNTVQKLNALKAIRYHHYREISDTGNKYFASNSGNCYFEFEDTQGESRLSRFQLHSETMGQVYNGTEYFKLHEATKTYEVEKPADHTIFSNLSLLYNSIPTLRKSLQTIVQDKAIPKTVQDTLIAGKSYHLVSFSLQNKWFSFPDGFSNSTINITKYYKLVIDKQSGLPYMVLDSNSISKGEYYTKTVFTEIDVMPESPETRSWFYSSYTDYKPEVKTSIKPLIALGETIKVWELPQFTGEKPLTFNSTELKGRVVLLEFWIKNCGYCIASFPYLKEFQEKYGRDKMEVLAINTYDKTEDIAYFYNKEKPNYKMLYNGDAFAKELGAVYYPTVILLDKSGKVIYTGSFDKKKLDQLIQANL